MKRMVIFVLACLVTLVSISISVSVGISRAATLFEAIVISFLYAICCVSCHLIISFPRKIYSFLLWIFLSIFMLSVHASFIINTINHASINKVQRSSVYLGLQKNILALSDEINGIKARSILEIKSELNTELDPGRKGILKLELAQSRKKSKLQDKLLELHDMQRVTEVTESHDKLLGIVTRVTKMDYDSAVSIFGLLTGLLFELLGVLLWNLVLNGSESSNSLASYCELKDDRLIKTAAAIKAGTLPLKVREIRQFLGCSQNQAREIRVAIMKMDN